MKGQPWSWAELSNWLANPKGYAAGNKMSFAGLKKPDERAAVMVWLNSQSANPLPIPAAPAEEAAAEAPAEEAPAAEVAA
jgi:cytochrome c